MSQPVIWDAAYHGEDVYMTGQVSQTVPQAVVTGRSADI
jgi:hypothetical protein